MSTSATSATTPTARMHGRLRRQIVSAASLVLSCTAVLVVVLLLAPTSIGGQASYVVTQGSSMLPTYEPGGMVVTRERDSYAVGDVVAYRNPELAGLVVMHRIVSTDGDRFVLQGDNNDFLDGYHPTSDDLVGEAWIYVPGAGQTLQWLRQPVVFGLLIALLTLVSVGLPRGDRGGRDDDAA